jgi:hypothetical protein
MLLPEKLSSTRVNANEKKIVSKWLGADLGCLPASIHSESMSILPRVLSVTSKPFFTMLLGAEG